MNVKNWYQSTGVVGGLVATIILLVKLFGLDLGEEQESITAIVTDIIGVVAGIVAIIGRVRAKTSIRNPLAGNIGGMVLLLLLPCILMAGCTRLPLSTAARGELAATSATAKALMPACQSGDDGACATMLAVEQKTLRHLASSIEGSDPNCKGYVGWMASSAYKEQILKADLLASYAMEKCPTDPNFCRLGVNLVPVIERLQSAAAGVK